MRKGRRLLRQLQNNFVLDGNSRTFCKSQYQPMLDKHLFFYFANEQRLHHLYRQHIVNKRFEIIDPTVKKLAVEMSKTDSRNTSLHKTLQKLRGKSRSINNEKRRSNRTVDAGPMRLRRPSKEGHPPQKQGQLSS